MTKKRKQAKPAVSGSSPVQQLASELESLRRDLRQTAKVYLSRLEFDLKKSSDSVRAYRAQDELSREEMHEVRDMTMLLRRRKLKPEKGRRKDLRKIDSLIEDLQLFLRNSNGAAD